MAVRRVAAIDVGSNAIRFMAIEAAAGGRRRTLDAGRAAVRLGHDAFRTGRIGAGLMDAALGALRQFRRRIDAVRVTSYRAVATSAVRESENGSELVRRADAECGVRLEPIDGVEEARLTWHAIRDRFDPGGRRWALVDLGGGSVEVSLVDAGGVLWTRSYPLGSVRLLEQLPRPDAASPRLTTWIRARMHDAEQQLEPLLRPRPAGIVAAGGNIEALAELAGAAVDAAGVRALPLAALDRVLDALAALTPAERARVHGLRPDRADVIVPGGLVYRRIAELAGAGAIVVPNVGVKEGLLLELAPA